jgi:hypothetical protein
MEIFRILEPVGTSWDDVEWEHIDTILGTYDDAVAIASDIARIQFYHPIRDSWEDA